MKMNPLDWVSCVLVIIGALNWGLIGFFDFNLVTTIFGHATIVSRVVYAIIGLAGLWMIYGCFKCCKKCKSSPAE